MSQGSYCPNCGFRTEQMMVACPRCRQPLRHHQCERCGRCPVPKEKKPAQKHE